ATKSVMYSVAGAVEARVGVVGACVANVGSATRTGRSAPGRRPPLRRRAPRELGADVVMVGDSFMVCWPWMQRPTTCWNHCALRALHSTAGTCSYTAGRHTTAELAEQGGSRPYRKGS